MTNTLIAPPLQLAALFDQLATRWREETRYLSSTTAIATNPSYQRIIGLGPQVIPLILAELQQRPEQWFWALASLTGENPVPPGEEGRIQAMRDAWMIRPARPRSLAAQDSIE